MFVCLFQFCCINEQSKQTGKILVMITASGLV